MKRQRGLLYGRRQGPKLSERQQDLWDNERPKWQVPLKEGKTINLAELFNANLDAYELEIGFGGGEHLAARAKSHPTHGFIGCEPYVNGVVKLLSQIKDEKHSNIRLYDNDARHILDALPDRSLSRAFILYPDPWPKKRHHKRRFVNKETLTRLARVIKSGGELLIASDIGDYISTSLLAIEGQGDFIWQAEKASDWLKAPVGWASTRYEAKALREGRTPHYLQLKRR